mmetsp:Transcript_11479/g.18163  ORF Transcript_11479/g.18163 Transcript_11479/m.18163 type:complete len:619 (-) Transcript_11479:106-1962(-)
MLSFLFGEEEPETVSQPQPQTVSKDKQPTDPIPDFAEYSHTVLVCGFASGKSKLNGKYRMTGKWIERRPVYASTDLDTKMCIWFSEGWCLGPKQHLGTSIAMAHNEHKGMRVWMTEKPWKVQVDREIRDEENVKVVPLVSAFVIGADGSNKGLNGCYELRVDLIKLPKSVRDKFLDRPVYKKEAKTGPAHCIWCCDQGWCIGLETDVGSKLCYAACDDSSPVPWLAKLPWKMVRNAGVDASAGQATPYWTDTSNLQVVPYAEAYLSGCGVSGGAWNGLYIMREDLAALPFFSRKTFRGRPVFQHKEGKQQCIWFSELGWCVGLEDDIGTTRCGIYNKSTAAVPWLCNQPWQVLENKSFSACSSLRITPVCTEETLQARVDRAKAASEAEAKKQQNKTSEMNTENGFLPMESSKLVGELGKIQITIESLGDEIKKLCAHYVETSVSVGLTQEMAETRLKEAEEASMLEPKERSMRIEKFPPLLKSLTEKQADLHGAVSKKQALQREISDAHREQKSKAEVKTSSRSVSTTNNTSDAVSSPSLQGIMPKLPERMVKGLDEELQRQIAEAERKIEEGPDLLDSLNPLPVLRDIPLFGDLLSLVAPAPKEEPLHAFEPGRFE